MKYLLIWETVPDCISAFVFDGDLDSELIRLARAAHGTYVGTDNDEAAQALNMRLEGVETVWSDDDGNAKNINGPFEEVFVSGFIL